MAADENEGVLLRTVNMFVLVGVENRGDGVGGASVLDQQLPTQIKLLNPSPDGRIKMLTRAARGLYDLPIDQAFWLFGLCMPVRST
jgi:hypothetical protein